MHLNVMILPLQRSFNSSSIPSKKLRSLDKNIRSAMLPQAGAEIRTIDLKEPLDGNQELKCQFVCLEAEFRLFIANPALCTKFEPECTEERRFKRIFRQANSGTVFKYDPGTKCCSSSFCFGKWRVLEWSLVCTVQFNVRNISFCITLPKKWIFAYLQARC